MRFRVVVASVILLCALLQAQTKVRAQPKPQPPPRKDDLTSAREATDRFLNGVKLAELPEGRQLLSETQWITGDADNGGFAARLNLARLTCLLLYSFQFTREFSLRFIAQYNGLLSNPQYSSLQTTKNMNFDVLFTYLLHPGTAVYIGYNSNLENVDPTLCNLDRSNVIPTVQACCAPRTVTLMTAVCFS